MPPRYNPPTKVVTSEVPFLALVVRDDASWARQKFNEVEYEFVGRTFRGNPYHRSAYTGELLTSGRLDSFSNASDERAQLAPDGSRTAIKLIEDTSTNWHWAEKQAPFSGTGNFAFYGDFKNAGRNLEIGFWPDDGSAALAYAWIDLTRRSIVTNHGAVGAKPISLTVSPTSNGYCTVCYAVTLTANSSVTAYVLTLSNFVSGQYTGDGSSGLLYANLHFHQIDN